MRTVEPPPGFRDLGLERQRQMQRLQSARRYDPALLGELGQLHFDMKDLFHAGRCWLWSDRTDDATEAVVDYFADRCYRRPHGMLSQTPPHALLRDLSGYPPVVQARLKRLGISAEDIATRISPPSRPVSRASAWLAAAVIIYFVACFLAGIGVSIWGIYRLIAWLFA